MVIVRIYKQQPLACFFLYVTGVTGLFRMTLAFLKLKTSNYTVARLCLFYYLLLWLKVSGFIGLGYAHKPLPAAFASS